MAKCRLKDLNSGSLLAPSDMHWKYALEIYKRYYVPSDVCSLSYTLGIHTVEEEKGGGQI